MNCFDNWNRKKILDISYCAPYDGVRHAGGKTHNFYLKELAKKFDIKLITFVQSDEIDKMDLDKYGIDHIYINYPRKNKDILYSKLLNVESRLNPFNRYGGFVSNYEEIKIKDTIKNLVSTGYKPDLILLEWTQILFFLPIIRKYFSQIPIFEIEVDVAFLGKERMAEGIKNKILRKMSFVRAKKIKKLEIENLKEIDRVFTNNEKDKLILIENGISSNKLDILMPYYDDYSMCKYNHKNSNIMFFGAMCRPENWKTAVWFIDNVMPLLDDNFTFTAVGNHPPKELIDKSNSRIKVTGFIESVNPYFEESLCLVSPLVLGAGVKVKIIESMTSGIPIVCNQISIEGINARDGEEYLHCETPEEFAKAIQKLANNKEESMRLGRNGKRLIMENYSFIKDSKKLIAQIFDTLAEKIIDVEADKR